MQFPLLLRGFVVLGIMLMHTAWFFNKDHTETLVTVTGMMLDLISLFAVPLFMFISGYLFVSRHRHANFYGLSFVKKMFLSVLWPYLLFSLLYIGGAYFFSNEYYTAADIFQMILTGSAAIHLGFFRALFGFFVFYPIIIKYFIKCRRLKKLGVYFAVVIALQIIWKIFNNIDFANDNIEYLIMATTFLRYIAYFSFGIAAWLYRRQYLRWLDTHYWLLCLSLVIFIPLTALCWVAKYYWHNYHILEFICFPLNLFLYTIIISMLFRYANTLEQQDTLSKRFVAYIGNYSFGIFLLHIVFMYLGVRLLNILAITPEKIIFYPLLFIIMLSLSLTSMELLVRIPLHQYLIGSVGKVQLYKRGDNLREYLEDVLKHK